MYHSHGGGNRNRAVGGFGITAWPSGADMLKVTSGTTSEPRAICFSAGQLLAGYEHICKTMGLRE